MIYSELKEQILSLGFENSAYLLDADQTKVFRDGINRALNFINVDFPIIGKYEISLDGSGDDFDEIDFADFSDFDVILNATIKKEVEGRLMILPFADFTISQDTIVSVWQGIKGTITFFYRTIPTPVTTSTTDSTAITIHYRAEQLLPLLASYYIFNDDDPEKAAKWRNEYEDMKNLILANSRKPKPYTFTGGM